MRIEDALELLGTFQMSEFGSQQVGPLRQKKYNTSMEEKKRNKNLGNFDGFCQEQPQKCTDYRHLGSPTLELKPTYVHIVPIVHPQLIPNPFPRLIPDTFRFFDVRSFGGQQATEHVGLASIPRPWRRVVYGPLIAWRNVIVSFTWEWSWEDTRIAFKSHAIWYCTRVNQSIIEIQIPLPLLRPHALPKGLYPTST